MRNTIILGLLVGLFGFSAAALASDTSKSGTRSELTREASTENRGERHDRYEHAERSRERHDESREHNEPRGRNDDSRERTDRR